MTIVNIIGAGRVARTLLRLLSAQRDIKIGQIASRRIKTAEQAVAEVNCGRAVGDVSDMSDADIWFLTVPDTQIANVASRLSQVSVRPAIAVHCSGYHVAGIMDALSPLGWRLASAHPVLSFADPDISTARFSGSYCGLEGDEAALSAIEPLFNALGARTFRIGSEGKVLYHAAAVVTNNFTTVLQGLALEMWADAGVPDDVARALNATLLASTLENAERLGPAEALTGPAARGDSAVVEAQGRAVAAWHPNAGALYRMLSEMAARLKSDGRTVDGQDLPRQ
ncbi:MAG: DUF2520 domain-containing protein [Boseongicola sp.]|nr:DUF2520 domain-containing protein [Boseongicola sp.]